MISKTIFSSDLKQQKKYTIVQNKYKAYYEPYIAEFAINAYNQWRNNKDEAYKNAFRFIESVPESILVEFMLLVDQIDQINPFDLMTEVKALEAKVKLDFEKELLLFPKAIAHFYQTNMNDCIVACKNIIRIFGNLSEAHILLANVYLSEFKFQEAISHFKAVIKSKQFEFEAKGNLAYCYLNLKKTRKAKRLFKQVVEIYPNNYKVQYNMAICYKRLKNRKKALFFLDRAAEIEPRFPGTFLTRGHIHLIFGNKILAKKDLEHAISLGSTQAKDLIKRV